MTGRLWTLLIMLVASSAGLAGCIEGFEGLSADESGISAMEDRDLADNAAAAWNPDAFLIGAVSVETLDARMGIPLDSTVGDGRAPFWYYGYAVPETQEQRLFRVTADGQVTVEEKLPPVLRGLDFEPVALTAWSVDSTAAISKALASEELSAIMAGANASIFEGVGVAPPDAPEEGPQWGIIVASETGFAVATVDAQTGELKIQDMASMPPMPDGMPAAPTFASIAKPIIIEDEGTLTNGALEKRYPFEAVEGMGGLLHIEGYSQLPQETLTWSLVDEDGETLKRGTIGGYFRSWEGTYEDIEFESTGGYEFVIRATSVADFITQSAHSEVDFTFTLVAGFDPAWPDDEAES